LLSPPDTLPAANRILVVEDSKPFRSFVSALLQEKQERYVVYEVSDGLEAVRHALELNPDLILMDIGLPNLNGSKPLARSAKSSPNQKSSS
jgi:CheY-like chemotaxis protein